jgi:hypothetical protein
MPHSIRTTLLVHNKKNFELFLKVSNLDNILVGSYRLPSVIPGLPFGAVSEECICYAYMDKNEDEKALLSFMTLKFGNLENAFREHLLVIGVK